VANPDPASTAPKPAVPLPSTTRACNSYLPDTSTLDRYLWAVQWFVANGFYVLVDYHPMGLDNASYKTATFVSSWQWLWSALSCLPNFESQLKGRVFLDLLNEPDSMGQRWEATTLQGRQVPGGWQGLGGPGLSSPCDVLWPPCSTQLALCVQAMVPGASWAST
jgi:hypothetical protein